MKTASDTSATGDGQGTVDAGTGRGMRAPHQALHPVAALAVLGALGAACMPELVNGEPTACPRCRAAWSQAAGACEHH
jgi:hypothetical protein